jgi:hypothetical protein
MAPPLIRKKLRNQILTAVEKLQPCFDELSINGKSSTIPSGLTLSKGETSRFSIAWFAIDIHALQNNSES